MAQFTLVARINPLRWIKGDPPPLEEVLKTMRERATKFNGEKIKPQDLGSVMPYGLDDHGRPIFLISTMAMHTQNLQADARASLLVTQENSDGEPLGASRVTLVGNVLPVPNSELAEVRKLYLERHANNKYWQILKTFRSTAWTSLMFITWAASE